MMATALMKKYEMSNFMSLSGERGLFIEKKQVEEVLEVSHLTCKTSSVSRFSPPSCDIALANDDKQLGPDHENWTAQTIESISKPSVVS